MKNDETPDDSGMPWNTEDLVFGGISCKQLSRLCTCFVSALRMSNGEGLEYGTRGRLALVRNLIDQQLRLVDSPNLTPEDRKIVETNISVGFQAICLAGVFAIDNIDARHITAVAVSAIQIVHKLEGATGPIGPDDEVIIQIRKGSESYGEEHIEMGVRLEPVMDMSEQMDKTDMGKEIKKIVEPPTLTPPPSDPNQQGLN